MDNIDGTRTLHVLWGKTALIVALCIALLIAFIFVIVFFVTNKASNADYYDISGDIFPSIKAVVGGRKISGVSVNTQDGVEQKEYTYKGVEDVTSDVLQYANYLKEKEGFKFTQDYDMTRPIGVVQMGKESKDNGKIILVNIHYSLGGYSIIIEKGAGRIDVDLLPSSNL